MWLNGLYKIGLSILVGTAGFEPATTSPPAKCATRLRYAPTYDKQMTLLIEEAVIVTKAIESVKVFYKKQLSKYRKTKQGD